MKVHRNSILEKGREFDREQAEAMKHIARPQTRQVPIDLYWHLRSDFLTGSILMDQEAHVLTRIFHSYHASMHYKQGCSKSMVHHIVTCIQVVEIFF
jgi:hypothetical protein